VPAYVDRRVVDLVAARAAAEVAATQLGLPEPELIRHGMNAIYRCSDVVLRVATPNAPAGLSIEFAVMLDRAGIPVAAPASDLVVDTHGHAVTAWGYVRSNGSPIDWRGVGEIVSAVHRLDRGAVPAGLPTPSPVEFPWWDHESLLDDVDDLLDDRARTGLQSAIERHRGWRDWDRADAVLCHGDVHPGNVIMTDDGPVLVDWDLLCVAPPGWDHAPMMTWAQRWGGAPGEYDALAGGAGWSARGDRFGEAFAELRLVSATLMRLKVLRTVAAAAPEAMRRLAYWRGDPDAPIWQAQ
jgi:aminoglycoside phosphotransferase (APT) family kinase protein